MKKIAVVFLAFLTFALCACRSEIPQTNDNPYFGSTDSEAAVCLQETLATTVQNYYAFALNNLDVVKMGDAYTVDDVQKGMTYEILGSSYPLYYSVTTRPSGELNEVDAYNSSSGNVILNFLRGTKETYVITFMDTSAPKVKGDLNEKNLTQYVLSLFPESFEESEYEKSYEGGDFGHHFVYTKKIGDFQTVERLECLFDYDGYLMEVRLQNYGHMEAVRDKAVDANALQVAVSGAVNQAYLQKDVNPIKTVQVKDAVMGKDVDGEVYYTVQVSVEYEKSSMAPQELNLIYYPERIA